MAKYRLEEVMCGEKYNIESGALAEAFKIVEENDSISDIPKLESLSLCKEE